MGSAVNFFAIWYHLYTFKKVKNTHGGVLLLVKLQALKVTLPRECFSRFLNCANSAKTAQSLQLFSK